MTIKEYYDNYKKNSEYPIKLTSGKDNTIDEFYNDCISLNSLPSQNVLAWHKMLMEYVDRPDAIYWVRYYEGCSKSQKNKNNGVWINRRGCLTEFKDGFSYVFVSNYDAHEIFNMIRLGVTPDVDEFLELMKTHQFKMHYDKGKSCEESSICSYPNIGNTKGGILTSKQWYLAHIIGIKSEYLRRDGSYEKITDVEKEIIFPLGNIMDWKLDNSLGYKVRKLDYQLSQEEKEIVKAHFLRFIDPLNYYVTPGDKSQMTPVINRIGDLEAMNDFMSYKYETIYGIKIMDEFRKKALIKTLNTTSQNVVIDISYGPKIKTKVPKNNQNVNNSKQSVNKVGRYAKNLFQSLLEGGKLNNIIISNLMDKNYCRRELGIYFPILVDETVKFDKTRYYKNKIVGKYYICSQWYEKNRIKIDNWIKSNGL